MVRRFFATSTEVYLALAILFIFSYRAGRDTEPACLQAGISTAVYLVEAGKP
jgi:hypothetical protein